MNRVEIRRILIHCVGLSLTITLSPLSYALSPINSTQDGRIIQAGTFYNTPTGKTTFLNSHSGDLWLKSGSTVRGLEVNNSGNLNNNGGTIQLYAPKSVVRVDGNINVNGLVNGQGDYLGNGGKVLVNSAYLYQNGNITALGNQGGHVNINVNSATYGPTAKIDVSSPTGGGGSIHINATGVVDIRKGAVLNSSGIPLPGVDSNVIEVIGRVVNNEGVINANGINSTSGMNNASKGGTIQLVANNGSPNLQPVVTALASSTVFSLANKLSILNRLQGLVNNYANSIRNTGSITANGGSDDTTSTTGGGPGGNGGNGGTISLTASRKILNQSTGIITANGGSGSILGVSGGTTSSRYVGGNGGQIRLSTMNPSVKSQNNGLIQANGGSGETNVIGEFGIGGQGGSILLRNFNNTGSIAANGGEGVSYSSAQGGIGGTINAINLMNTKAGSITAKGGDTSGHDSANGGVGGRVIANNLTNNGTVSVDGGVGGGIGATGGYGGLFLGENILNAGNITATGGAGSGMNSLGGHGGRIQIENLTNTGLIAANGGLGNSGGNGGLLTFNTVKNSGTIESNGGNTFIFNVSGPAGNGGTIIGTNTVNTGTVEALGGIRADGGPNGANGTVIGF